MSSHLSLKSAVISLFVLAIFLTVPSLHRPFFSRGEPREVLVASAMLTTGNWISPAAYGGDVPSKPPFTHWIMAALSVPVGAVSEVTARLPSAIFSIVFLPLFCIFVARRTDPTTGVITGLVLLSSPEWFRAATSCRVDTVLSVLFASALCSLFAWHERGLRGISWPAIVCLAGATLTKGPVGFCLPGVIFALYLLLEGDVRRDTLPSLVTKALLLLLPVLILTSFWYALGYLQRGDEFLSKVWYENFERLSSTMEDEPHRHSVAYLWGVTVVGLLPWSFLILIPFLSWVRKAPSYRASHTFQALVNEWRLATPLTRYSWLVVLVTVILFSIPASKRAVYVLPAYPYIALLLALVLRRIASRLRAVQWVGFALSVFGVFVPLLVLSSKPFVSPNSTIGRIAEGFALGFGDYVFLLEAGVVVLVVVLARSFLRHAASDELVRPFISVALAVCIVNALVVTGVAPLLSTKHWLQAEDFRRSLGRPLPATIHSYGSERYDASFYLATPFDRLTKDECEEAQLIFHEAEHLDELEAMCGDLEVLTSFLPFGERDRNAVDVSVIRH